MIIKDIFLSIDQSPKIMRRPFLPYTNTSFRIPFWAKYNPQIVGWPSEPFYFIEEDYFEISAILVGGRRFSYTAQQIPPSGFYTLHKEEGGVFICIGFLLESLWMYERIEVIATESAMFSMYGSKNAEGTPNSPMVLSMSEIKKKADALRYSSFSFDKLTFSFIRDESDRDLLNLFGGQMIASLRTEENNQIGDFPLGKYIINDIQYDVNELELEGIDYRYELNRKYPTELFSRSDYPFLEDKYVDRIKPAAIGICNGVPGICLNGRQIYTIFPTRLTHYDFQFPSGWIGDPIKIEVKNGDLWSEVFPGLGNPFIQINDPVVNDRYVITNPEPVLMDSASGLVRIDVRQVLEGMNWLAGVKDVRMFAKWPASMPKDAIQFLLSKSDNQGELANNFNGEFNNLAPIGLYMDESRSLFEWIEQVQSSNIIGGQLLLRNNNLFFKLENPNRARRLLIPDSDVINHENLSVELAKDFWFSGWEIFYNISLSGREQGSNIAINDRFPTASIFNGYDATVPLVYRAPTDQEYDTQFLQQRAMILRDLVFNKRYGIKNVQVPMHRQYLELEFYDIVGYIPRAINHRTEPLDWLVYDIKKNLRSETITLTLVERKMTEFWNGGHE